MLCYICLPLHCLHCILFLHAFKTFLEVLKDGPKHHRLHHLSALHGLPHWKAGLWCYLTTFPDCFKSGRGAIAMHAVLRKVFSGEHALPQRKRPLVPLPSSPAVINCYFFKYQVLYKWGQIYITLMLSQVTNLKWGNNPGTKAARSSFECFCYRARGSQMCTQIPTIHVPSLEHAQRNVSCQPSSNRCSAEQGRKALSTALPAGCFSEVRPQKTDKGPAWQERH